jgi:hypothetical protein
MTYLYVKKIVPALDQLQEKDDKKNFEALQKKSIQAFMLPITEYLKNNDPKLNNSVYKLIPSKCAETLAFLANKDIDVEKLETLFADISETFMIGLDRSPQNAIKILSGFLSSVPSDNKYYERVQKIGIEVIQHLYKGLREGLKTMSKDNIGQFEKDIEIFSYISHNLLTKELNSSIFDLNSDEILESGAVPHEYTLLISILEIVKMLRSKLKADFLETLEIIQEKMCLCLILRCNHLYRRNDKHTVAFMEGPMLDLICDKIKEYDISDDRYLRFVIQYISPAD